MFTSCVCEQDLAFNNLLWFLCHKTKPNLSQTILSILANLDSTAVWTISILPWISNESILFFCFPTLILWTIITIINFECSIARTVLWSALSRFFNWSPACPVSLPRVPTTTDITITCHNFFWSQARSWYLSTLC